MAPRSLCYRFEAGGFVLSNRVMLWPRTVRYDEITLSTTLVPAAVNDGYSLVVNVSELVGFLMVASEDVTVKTNDPISPDDTIELRAHVPLVCHRFDYYTDQLTVSITTVWLTNLNPLDAATFEFFAIKDR